MCFFLYQSQLDGLNSIDYRFGAIKMLALKYLPILPTVRQRRPRMPFRWRATSATAGARVYLPSTSMP